MSHTAERPSHSSSGEPATPAERFKIAFDQAAIGMTLADGDGRCLEVNDALCHITGWSADQLKATTLRAMTHRDDVALDAQLERDLLNGRIRSYQIEKRLRHRQGHYLWVLVSVSRARDDRGQPLCVITQVQNISERKLLAERLEYLVNHDFLTGLFNKRRFEQELTKEARRAERYGSSGAVVLVDLDKFKDVNDAFGHKVGDELLKAVALALSHRMRQTDVLARVGGDEFAILLPHAEAKQAEVVAEGIVAAVRDYVAVGPDKSIRVTASAGVAILGNVTPTELMDNADRAMYETKAAGRNGFVMFASAPIHEQCVAVVNTIANEA